MKKILFLVLCALVSISTYAQLVESSVGGGRVYKIKNPAPEMRYSLKLSGGVTTIKKDSWNGEYHNSKFGPSVDLTFSLERHFNYKSNLYWGGRLGIGYVSPKFDCISHEYGSYKYGSYILPDQTVSANMALAHIGPTIGFCKSIGANTKINVGLTPEFVAAFGSGANCSIWHDEHEEVTTVGNIGISGTLNIDFIINKFIVGLNYRYIVALESDLPQTIMASVGYCF